MEVIGCLERGVVDSLNSFTSRRGGGIVQRSGMKPGCEIVGVIVDSLDTSSVISRVPLHVD